MDPIFFSDQNEFRDWLDKNHDKKTEIMVGYHKVATGKPGLSWSESVDQARPAVQINHGLRKPA
jgi:uncharacterized protein YdeI (YjbR/CyaY-like superfamily)